MTRRLTLTVAAGALALCAFQSALTPAGWTDVQARQMAESFFSRASADETFFLGYLTREAKATLKARPPADRAQIVKNLALHAKRMVQTPEFERLHTVWIREHLNAIDHGIKADRNAAAPEMNMNAARGQMAAGLADGLKDIPPEGLKLMLQSEADSLAGSKDPADKNRLAQVKQMQSLIPARITDAKKQYISYMVAKLGGPADEASIQASVKEAAQADAQQKRMEQQSNYNKNNLKAQLRERLSAFIVEAKSVDFNAQTRPLAGRNVFANSAYESKRSSWQLLYRMGREPVMAALEVAEQWRREL